MADYVDKVKVGNATKDIQDSGARTNEGMLANLTTTEKTNLVGAINEVNAAASDLKDALIDPNFIPTNWSWNDSHFVNVTNGDVGDSTSYSYFTVNVLGYLALKVTSQFGSIAGICFYDSNGNFIPKSGIANPGGGNFSDEIVIPENAATMSVSCIKNSKSAATITIPPKMFNGVIQQKLNAKANLPNTNSQVDFTEIRGLRKKDLTLYDQGEDYSGRTTSISVTPGDVYLISGTSTNANFPCAQYVNGSSVVTELLGGSSVIYTNERITIPSGAVTLYVNGSTNNPINILKVVQLTQDEFDAVIQPHKPLKCRYYNGVLSIKKKYNDSRDFVLTFGNVGANSLFNFRSAYYMTNTGSDPSDTFAELSAIASWTMNSSDWLGPYIVSADSGGDGSESDFTGGNHKINDTITAEQDSLTILLDGKTAITDRNVHQCDSVTVKWKNIVDGYNTVGDRGVLSEEWTMVIDQDGVRVHNVITALEDITLEKYYGLQATCGGKSYRYIGGESREVYAIGTDAETSGNNTCRTAEIFDANFHLAITVDPVDLGLYSNNNGSSFFVSSTKLYAYLVSDSYPISISQGEKYDVVGTYVFK